MLELKGQYSLDAIFKTDNVAEILSKEDLQCLGHEVVCGFNTDEDSRLGWKDRTRKALKLAMQVKEKKNTPWEGASNVKYPLLTIAALQFQSRASPALITTPDLVKSRPIGDDPDGSKTAHAQRVSDFMSYQLLEEDENWVADTDRMFLMLPIIGCMFRKTYFDPITGKNCSDLLLPDDFVVSYYTKNLKNSPRYTVVLHLNESEVQSKINSKYWLDVDLVAPTDEETTIKEESLEQRGFVEPDPSGDSEDDRWVLEQYIRIDLDNDGYGEPYICTVDKTSEKVLRVVPNFSYNDIRRDNQGEIDSLKDQLQQIAALPPQGQTTQQMQVEQLERRQFMGALMQQLKKLEDEGTIIYIEPIEYITKYPFIPSPDGGFYDIGFGQLLEPINDSVDTIINQLIDAGTLQNSNVGFLASNARIRGADMRFRPFEYKRVEVPAGTLKDGILPLPVNQPSQVLLELLNILISQGQQIASTTDVMTGELPGQNTKAGVAAQALDQGMKVFSGIVLRLYRAFTMEYRKLYRLNRLYLDPKKYFETLGIQPSIQIQQEDFAGNPNEVMPEADPNLGSDTQRIQQVSFLSQRASSVPGYNPQAVEIRLLKAMRIPAIQEIYTGAPPPPNPELMLKSAEQQRKVVESHTKLQIAAMEAQAKIKALEVQMYADLAQLEQAGDQAAVDKTKTLIAGFEAIHSALDAMHQRQIEEQELEQQAQAQQQQQAQPQQAA